MITSPRFHIIKGKSLNIPMTSNEKMEFMRDMHKLFRGEECGHVGRWQYSNKEFEEDLVEGAALWSSFIEQSSDYYLLKNEIELINKYACELIDNNEAPVSLVDFGPGPSFPVLNKTLPIARMFKNMRAYCPIDKNYKYLIDASEEINNEYPYVRIKAFNADYFKDDIQLAADPKPFALFFGSSISNIPGSTKHGIPEKEVIFQLSRLRRIVGDRGSLLMGYDANQDAESIIRSYSHPIHKKFGINLMQRVRRDLPVYGDFDSNAWHYEPIWHPENHQLCHTAVADKDQVFMLGREFFDIKQGEQFILNNSYKYPIEKMCGWGKEAGFENQKYIIDTDERCVLHIMKAK